MRRVGVNTHAAGADCVRDGQWASVKIYGGLEAEDHAKRGNTYPTQNGLVLDGWLSERNTKHLNEKICDTFDGIADRFKREYIGKAANVGFFAADRARFCMSKEYKNGKDELKRYRDNTTDLYEMIVDRRRGGQVITIPHIWEAQELSLRQQVEGRPGVYLLIDPALPYRVYIGESKNIATRKHRNSSLHMRVCWTTASHSAAKSFEENLRGSLRASGLVRFERKGTNGYQELSRQYDALTVVTQLVTTHHRSYCRGQKSV